jgi:hypothetical protein
MEDGRRVRVAHGPGDEMLTLRLTDFFLMLLTAFACAAAIYAITLMRRMNQMADDWRKTMARFNEILPSFKNLCVTSEEAMRSVKGLADQGNAAMTDVVEVTGQIRDVAEEGLSRLHGLMGALNTASMLVTSFKAGLEAVKALKSDDEQDRSADDSSFEETEDEKGNL